MITGSIRRNSLDDKDVKFLRMLPKETMTDFVPSTDETTSVDLLVEADYFWDIVRGEKVILTSGSMKIWLHKDTGRCPKSSHIQGSNPGHNLLLLN